MKKRVISYLLAFIMIMGIVPFISVDALASDARILVNLTSADSILRLGLTASGTHKKDGDYSAYWGADDNKKEIVIDNIDMSQSNGGYIEYWVYSAKKTDMRYTLILMADNRETPQKDYYYATDIASWQGWRKAAIKLGGNSSKDTDSMSWAEYDKYENEMLGRGSFIAVGEPRGIALSDKLIISKLYGETGEEEKSDLYFSNIELRSELSPEAVLSANMVSDEDDKLILADFTSKEATEKTPFEYSEEMGALKIAAPNLTKSYTIATDMDWSQYDTINIEASSNINDRNRMSLMVYSENTASTGDDYWRGEIIYNWQDKWKTVQFSYDSQTGETDMKTSREPLGFDSISKLVLSTNFGNNIISEDKIMYIKRIYLSKTKGANDEYSSDKDYIPAANMEGVDKSIIDKLKETDKRKQHPRLLTDEKALNKNIELYMSGENVYLTNTMNNILALADSAVDKETAKYGLADGTRLVDTEFEAIRPLSVAYVVTGERKYRDRLWAALEEMASWPDWAPEHLLRTCEAAYSFGLAYDLCYDSWTETEKRIIRNAIVKHGIMPALKQWRAGAYPSDTATNWQLVCAGGIGFAAMAIIDEPGYLELCTEMVSRTIETIPLGLSEYKDDGSYPEGIGYWKYATPYLYNYIKALNLGLGTDYGLSEYEGLSNTGFFPIVSAGPNGTYNFSDGSLRVDGIKDACMFYLAKLYGETVLADFYVQSSMTTGEWDSFIQYDDTVLTGEDYRKKMPLDYIYRGHQQNVYSRSSWDGKESVWLAYKGRYGNAAHSDLDAGSFILDMQGIRWFADLGSGDYDADGYFDTKDKRWDYYRKRAEAHNTLVINPSKEPDQVIDAVSEIIEFKNSEFASYGIIDMSAAYPDAEEVKRGLALVNNRSEVIIQDEIKTKAAINLYSFFTTEHAVEISENGKTAYITAKGGEKIRADILSNTNATWSVMEPKPLPTSPDPEGNYTNKGGTVSLNIDSYNKLFIHLNSVSNPTISVKISSSLDEEYIGEILPIDEWDSYLKPSVYADMIYVDDIALDSFTKGNSFYTLNGIIGNIRADFDEDRFDVSYTQAQSIGDTASCTLTDRLSGKTAKYYISFKEPVVGINSEIFTKIPVATAEQSKIPEAANGPDKSIDDDYTTASTFEGEGELIWSLADTKSIDRILLAFSRGDQRNAIFDIYTSLDKENWDMVYSGMSSGKTLDLEAFPFNKEAKAKYVKFLGHGNSINGWNAILEVFIPEAIPEFGDISGHWAEKSIIRMRNAGLIKGTSNTSFEPEKQLSISEVLLMLCRFMNFDVDNEADFSSVISAAKEGAILPDGLDKLKSDRIISRQEMAAVLALCYEKISASSLADVNLERFFDNGMIDNSYKEAVKKVLSARLLNGVSYNEFAPTAPLTRAQAATIIERLYIIKNK